MSGQLVMSVGLGHPLGLNPGNHQITSIEDGKLKLEKTAVIVRGLKQEVAYLRGYGLVGSPINIGLGTLLRVPILVIRNLSSRGYLYLPIQLIR